MKKLRNKTFLIIGILIAIVIVVVFFFLRGGGYKAPTTQQVPAPGTTGVEEKVVSPGETTSEITVEADEYSFSPSSINVKAGEKVKLTFRNVGSLPHNFTLSGLNVSTRTISGGQTDTIEFVPKTGGTLTFFCSVGNHRSLGMEGNLEVE